MNPRIKKVIAREGLIIIAILFFSGVCFFVNSWVPYEDSTALYDVTVGEDIYRVEIENPSAVADVQLAAYDSLKRSKPDLILPELPERRFIPIDELITGSRAKASGFDPKTAVSVSELPNGVEVKFVKWKYSFKAIVHGKSLTIALMSLFLFYPIYLLIRFIIWAIKTLRKDSQEKK